MGEQTSLTDQFYDKDIKLAELYNRLRLIERDIHFLRTVVGVYGMQNPSIQLGEIKSSLTSVLDWMGDLLFYLDGASCDIKSKSLESYKKLRDMNNPVDGMVKVRWGDVVKKMGAIERAIFHAFHDYEKYVEEVKPCGTIFEILDDEARVALRLAKGIRR